MEMATECSHAGSAFTSFHSSWMNKIFTGGFKTSNKVKSVLSPQLAHYIKWDRL